MALYNLLGQCRKYFFISLKDFFMSIYGIIIVVPCFVIYIRAILKISRNSLIDPSFVIGNALLVPDCPKNPIPLELM